MFQIKLNQILLILSSLSLFYYVRSSRLVTIGTQGGYLYTFDISNNNSIENIYQYNGFGDFKYAIERAPDILAIASSDLKIYYYDLTSFSVNLGFDSLHTSFIFSMIMPSSNILLTASYDLKAFVWNLSSTPTRTLVFAQHTYLIVEIIQIVGYGDNLVGTASYEKVLIWNWVNGSIAMKFDMTTGIGSLTQVSSDIIAVGETLQIQIYSLRNQSKLMTIAYSGLVNNMVAYSSDMLVATDVLGSVKLWCWKNGSLVSSFTYNPVTTIVNDMRLIDQDILLVANTLAFEYYSLKDNTFSKEFEQSILWEPQTVAAVSNTYSTTAIISSTTTITTSTITTTRQTLHQTPPNCHCDSTNHCKGCGGKNWGDDQYCIDTSTCIEYSLYGTTVSTTTSSSTTTSTTTSSTTTTSSSTTTSSTTTTSSSTTTSTTTTTTGSSTTTSSMTTTTATTTSSSTTTSSWTTTAATSLSTITTTLMATSTMSINYTWLEFDRLSVAEQLRILRSGMDVTNCLLNCSNNGMCKISEGVISCSCVGNYTGDACEINLDPCSSLPCFNNGSCSVHINYTNYSYECTCPGGWYLGKNCETKRNLCHNITCSGHGTCRDLGHETKCDCHYLYSGDDCSTETNENKKVKTVSSTASIIAIIVIVLLFAFTLFLDIMSSVTIIKKKKIKKPEPVKFNYVA